MAARAMHPRIGIGVEPATARQRVGRVAVILLAAFCAAGMIGACEMENGANKSTTLESSRQKVRLAVLGDSDSHSYHDVISFPPDSKERGGALRPSTFQWTEVLERLRASEIDQGAWGTWGTRGKLTQVGDWFGLTLRAPRKQDFRFNFAFSGATCRDLMQGTWRQAPRLVALMSADPDRWRAGVVIVRIGINSLGRAEMLARFARSGPDALALAQVDECLDQVRQSVDLLRQRNEQTQIILVGILSNADWPPNFGRWHSREEIARIEAVCNLYDEGLRQIARTRPRVAFYDDRDWFRRHWGSRDGDGNPAYRVASLPGGLEVSNTQGDGLEHGVVADGHFGTGSNALWAQDLVTFLNHELGIKVSPISDAELADFLRGLRQG